MNSENATKYSIARLGDVKIITPSLARPNKSSNIFHSWIFQLTDQSIRLLSQNLSRTYTMIQNPSTSDIVLGFDVPAFVGQGFTIPAGGFYELLYNTSSEIYARMVTTGATGTISIIEGTNR